MTPIVKGLIAVPTVGAIGLTGSYAIGLFNSPEPKVQIIKTTTKDRLKNEDFQLLDTSKNNANWDTILGAYQKAKTKTFTSTLDVNMKELDLRAECERQLNLETEKSYELARQWCVKEAKVSDILGKKYTILNTAQETTSENTAWANNVKKLKESTEEKFKSLRDLMKTDNTNVATLKKECGNLNPTTVKTTDETFGDVFEKTREFCSIKK